MSSDTADDGINWEQLADLMGDAGDLEQRAMVADMWRDVKLELPKEWAKVDAARDNDSIRREMHRVRGYIATWGMEGVAKDLLAVEKGPDPLSGWREKGASLIAAQRACIEAVEMRYPALRDET